jgi:hypothetical protein
MVIPGSRESNFVWIQEGDISATCSRGRTWYNFTGLNQGFLLFVYDHTIDWCPREYYWQICSKFMDSTRYSNCISIQQGDLDWKVYDREDTFSICALGLIGVFNCYIMSQKVE